MKHMSSGHACSAEATSISVIPYFKHISLDFRCLRREEMLDIIAVDRKASIKAVSSADGRDPSEVSETNSPHSGSVFCIVLVPERQPAGEIASTCVHN